jgi:hypothetical protein
VHILYLDPAGLELLELEDASDGGRDVGVWEVGGWEVGGLNVRGWKVGDWKAGEWEVEGSDLGSGEVKEERSNKEDSVNKSGKFVVASALATVLAVLALCGAFRLPVWFGAAAAGELSADDPTAVVGRLPAAEVGTRCLGVIFNSGWKNLNN